MSLQIKRIRFFNEHANQIVDDEIKFLNVLMFRRKNSKRNKRTNNVCVFRKFVYRFECRNRKTKKIKCNDES